MSAGKRLSLIALFGLLSPILLFGQFPNGLTADSVDPQKDSAVFAAMREKMSLIRKQRPTVALVLSGGGAKGACHIGVLEFIEEKGIPVDMVIGTSMGGLIGGLYGVGYDAPAIDSIISGLDWDRIMSDDRTRHTKRKPLFSSVQNDGYLYGDNVYGLLSALTAGYQDSLGFKDLPIPFFCVATDILTTKAVNWSDGHLLDAMRSTMSLPVVFKPFRKNGQVMLDGGMRNNFPVDIARAMGADIIIGVDVSARTTIESLDSMAGIVIESLSSMGNDSYRANCREADIFIRPDMEPYGTMSWAHADIDSLIERGYSAAIASSAQLDSIVALTGRCERRLAGNAARDLREDTFAVKSISIQGVSEKQSRYFSRKCRLKVSDRCSQDAIREVIADLYGTGAFKSVTYRIMGKEEPYDILFVCEEAPERQVELGLRIDTEEAVSIMANASLWSNTISGSRLDLNLKASMNPSLEAVYSFRPVIGPTVKVSSKIHYVSNWDFRFWHNDNKIYIQNPNTRIAYYKAGARFQPSPNTFSAFAEGGCDTRNDRYFPTRGIKAVGGYEYVFGPSCITNIATLGIEGAISCGKVFTIIPSLQSRAILGWKGYLPYFMKNYIGGAIPGRYFEHQIAMLSFTRAKEADALAAVSSLTLRFNLFKNFYLDGIAEALAQPLCKDWIIWGGVLRASYKTPAGPISTNIHWNSDTHTVGAYLSLGFDF